MTEISIRVNGQQCCVPAGSTVGDLIAARGLAPTQVAVEINKQLVPRATRDSHQLAPGDRVELVTLVGGG
jgi:sulfur carrier protein